jgi:hypothetical protein
MMTQLVSCATFCWEVGPTGLTYLPHESQVQVKVMAAFHYLKPAVENDALPARLCAAVAPARLAANPNPAVSFKSAHSITTHSRSDPSVRYDDKSRPLDFPVEVREGRLHGAWHMYTSACLGQAHYLAVDVISTANFVQYFIL